MKHLVKISIFLELIWVHLCILIIKKKVLILGKGPTQGYDNAALTAEAQCSIKFSISNRKCCLSLHCNESNSFLFVNGTKIHQFKADDSEIKNIPSV